MLWYILSIDNQTMRVRSIVSSDDKEKLIQRAVGWIAIHNMADRGIGTAIAMLRKNGQYDCGLITIQLMQGEPI